MPGNDIKSTVIEHNAVHHCRLIHDLLIFKESIKAQRATTEPSTETQNQFYYAALSTQDYHTYIISVVILTLPPSEIWQDVNNIPTLQKDQNIYAKVRTAIACFVRLFIQSKTFAEKRESQPTEIDIISSHSEQDILPVLQYLNGDTSSIRPHWAELAKSGMYPLHGQTALNALPPYIPLLSPLQLTFKNTISLDYCTLAPLKSEQITYLELLLGISFFRLDHQTAIQRALKEFKGNYGLYCYPALASLNTVAFDHKIYFMLSHITPMEILSCMHNTDDMNAELNKELAPIIRFVTRFVEAKTAMKAALTHHHIENSIDIQHPYTETSKALQLLNSPLEETCTDENREKLAFAYNSIAYIPSALDFTDKTTTVKILYSPSIHYNDYLVYFLSNINEIRRYVQYVIRLQQTKQNWPSCYYYLGISQESPSTFHLLLMVSQKSPQELYVNRAKIVNLSPEEQNALNFAKLLNRLEEVALRNTCTQSELNQGEDVLPTQLKDTLNVLHTHQPHRVYTYDAIERLHDYEPLHKINITPHALSELDLANKSFITPIESFTSSFNIKAFSYSSLLYELNTMILRIASLAKSPENYPVYYHFYYYPCLAKKAQDVLYLHIAISHKSPEEVATMLDQKLEQLSKEEQGIKLCANIFFLAQKAFTLGNRFCPAVSSKEELMTFLSLLNDKSKQTILDDMKNLPHYAERVNDAPFELSPMADSIPFISINRLNASDFQTDHSALGTLSRKRPHAQLDNATSQTPPPFKHQRLNDLEIGSLYNASAVVKADSEESEESNTVVLSAASINLFCVTSEDISRQIPKKVRECTSSYTTDLFE